MNDADVLRAAAAIIRDHSDRDLPGRPAELEAAADKLTADSALHGEPIPWTAGLFTRDEVSTAVNDGADLVTGLVGAQDRLVEGHLGVIQAGHLGVDDQVDQVGDLVGDPDAGIADLDAEGFLDDEDDPPEPGTPEYDAAVVKTVKGWVA